LHLYHGDVTDGSFITSLIYNNDFNEIYHLAAQSHVMVSFENPVFTSDVTGTGAAVMLEAIRTKGDKNTRFYFAGSSELFGNEPAPQDEETPIVPRSPYGCSKAYGYWMTKNYREGYGLHCSNGILFNHESPRRGKTFLTRKVALAAARISLGLQDTLTLGNMNASRDWGYAPDFVEAMWMMLQQDKADDYVIATGETHSVEEFVDIAFKCFNLDWHKYVKIDPKYFRPTEVNYLKGNPDKARKVLGWVNKTSFKDLVDIMCKSALQEVMRETGSHCKPS